MKMIYCQPCIGHGLEPIVFKLVTIEELIDAACSFLKVDKDDIISKKRYRHFSEPRHMIMAYLAFHRPFKLVDIARNFNRDHTTVVYAKYHVSDLCATDNSFSYTFNSLKTHLSTKLPQ